MTAEAHAHVDVEERTFTCNICGTLATSTLALIAEREAPSCSACGSNRRFRTMVHGLSLGLFRTSMPLAQFPVRPEIVGVGMSDAHVYAVRLADKFSYTNTFYDTIPQLDITDPDRAGLRPLDFLIASDVFEHVAPPVDVAFRNARRLLKRGGVFIFSVPYGLAETTEHYPNLHEFRLEKEGDDFVLVNRARDGTVERHGDLVFHGGPGSTLEMRVFGLRHLYRLFRANGFTEPRLLDEQVPEFGLEHVNEVCSVPMVVRAV